MIRTLLRWGALSALAVSYTLFFYSGVSFVLTGTLVFLATYALLLPLFSLGLWATIAVGLIFAADIITLKTYGWPLGLGPLSAIYETNWGEGTELLRLIPGTAYAWGIGWAAAFVAVTHGLVLRPAPAGRWRRRVFALGLAAALGLFALFWIRARRTQKPPHRGLGEIALAFAGRNSLARIAVYTVQYGEERLVLHRLGGSADWGHSVRTPDPSATVLVVIGEAARRDHLSLYGYGRKTTPYLDSIRSELVVFDRAVSPAPLTNFAVPLTLSLAQAAHYDVRDLRFNLVNLANQSGVRTAWLSNQGYLGPTDTTVSFIARQARRALWLHNDFFAPSDDSGLLPLVRQQLAEGPGQLIFVHLRGSHEQFVDRYPRSAAVFRPDTGIDLANIIDAYDNSVLYTDRMLEQMIAPLRDRNAALVYYSDHGLTQSDHPPFLFHTLNGAVSPGTYEVPLVLWFSASWREKHPGQWRELREISGRPFSTGNVFWIAAYLLGWQELGNSRPLDVLRRPADRMVVLGSDGQRLDYSGLIGSKL